jgi:hypothetical protein
MQFPLAEDLPCWIVWAAAIELVMSKVEQYYVTLTK